MVNSLSFINPGKKLFGKHVNKFNQNNLTPNGSINGWNARICNDVLNLMQSINCQRFSFPSDGRCFKPNRVNAYLFYSGCIKSKQPSIIFPLLNSCYQHQLILNNLTAHWELSCRGSLSLSSRLLSSPGREIASRTWVNRCVSGADLAKDWDD